MGLTNNLGRLSDALTADGSLNVGVGASPNASYKLDVTGAGRYQDNLLVSKNQNAGTSLEISNTTSGTTSQAFTLYTSDASSGNVYFGKRSSAITTFGIIAARDSFILNGVAGDIAIANNVATGTIKFAAGASTTAQLTIAANGNVTQSVNQNAQTSLTVSNTTSGTSSQSSLAAISDANSGAMSLGKYSTTTTAYKIVASKDGYLYNNTTGGNISILNDFATGTIRFAAGGSSTAQLTIAANGNIGIGITPNTWASSRTVIDIKNGATLTGYANGFELLANAYNDGSNWRYIASSFASGYQSVNGAHYWYTAASGTAGNVLTFSQPMTLTAAGRLLIGTTTESTFLLDVNGTGRFQAVDYKRLNPTTTTTASTATLTPDISAGDTFTITAQAASLSLANPTGTPVNGQKMVIRIKDNGTARAITFSGTQYRASSDLAFPTTTIVNKTLYMGFIWNSTDSKWDMLALLNNF